MAKFILLVMCYASLFRPGWNLRPDLGFLFPIGKAQLPQTADLTTYSFRYIFEDNKFSLQNDSLTILRNTLNTGKAFTEHPLLDDSISTLAKNTALLINQTLDTVHDIKHITDRSYVHGEEAAVNETVVIDTDKWYPETSLYEVSRLAIMVAEAKNFSYPKDYKNSDDYRRLITNLINLNNELTKYHHQLLQFFRLIHGAQQDCISTISTQILAEHVFEIPEDSFIEQMTITYYSSGYGSLDFEVKVLVYGEMQLFESYKSVPYMKYKINHTYYSDLAHTRLFTIQCKNDLCFEVENDTCASALYLKDLTKILDSCEFEYEDIRYEITDQGIFIYSTPSDDLKALLEKHGLTTDKFPTLVQFSDCFSLKQNNLIVSGCMDLETKQFVTRYDQGPIEARLSPHLGYQVYQLMQEEPWVITMIGLPVSVIFLLCILYKCCSCMFCPKNKYKPVIDSEAHVNYNRKRRSNRSGRSTRSSRSNRSRHNID